ncbi:MAG: aspartate-semialdehyde dehydrogenase [Elusimicrobia bacterium]|nr:aspartate-semialdehyde dehydrogenase [Elusimicrobiota bacterium]
MPAARSGIKVGVVGATGMVGRELLAFLEKSRFPVGELLPFSSGKQRKSVRFKGRGLLAPTIDEKRLSECDLVFFVSADEVSRDLAPGLSASGVWVIDDSSAFRLDPKVPLIIPEVNASALSPSQRLIAGPNCTLTGLAVAGYPLHKAFGVAEVRMASYQSVSGAGRSALEELLGQLKASSPAALRRGQAPVLDARKLRARALPAPIAFNVIPQVGSFDGQGFSAEENKVAAELRKIWRAPDIKISVTAVRVPVLRGHSLSAWITLWRPATTAAASEVLAHAPGLALDNNGGYPTPLSCAGRSGVFAGRLRAGTSDRELCLWIVSDNLLKGAAQNSVQIAQELLDRGWLRRDTS